MRALLPDRRGSALIEFACVLPLLVMLLLTSFGLSMAVRAQLDLRNAAQTVADLVAQRNTVNQGDMKDFFVGAQLAMAPFVTASLGVATAEVSFGGSPPTSSVTWQDTEGNAGATMTSNAATSAAAGLGQSGSAAVIVVHAVYTVPFSVPYLPISSITLSTTTYASPRNETSVTCTSC